MADDLKDLGFPLRHPGGCVRFSVEDLLIPWRTKAALSAGRKKQITATEERYRLGRSPKWKRHTKVIGQPGTEKRTERPGGGVRGIFNRNDRSTRSEMMAKLLAPGGTCPRCGSLVGIAGLMAKPPGGDHRPADPYQFPRRGLTVIVYVDLLYGARKGWSDTALRTADSGRT